MSYTYDTLFTNYAFNKLAVNLANDGTSTYAYSPYNLIKVKIGNGDNSIDLDKTSLSRAMYELNITNVTVSSNSLIFTCEIPEEMEGFEITEIGLFDVTGTSEKMFSYSRVQSTKPSDLGYKLTIEINLTLRIVNFYPNLVEISINQDEKATQEIMSKLTLMFLYIEGNLERIINFTSDIVGKNKAQTIYEKQKDINEAMLYFIYTNKYFGLYNKFGDNIKDAFFINYQDSLSYSVNDIANDTTYIDITDNKLVSNGDLIFFNNPSTLSVNAKVGDYTLLTPLLNKIKDNVKYFDLFIDNNTLTFNVYGTNGNAYQMTYTFTDLELTYIKDNYVTYTVAFNGNPWAPSAKLFIDGIEKSITQISINLSDIIDDSSYLMRNYYENDSSLYNKYLDIQNILFVKKYVNATEAYYLYMTQRIRNVEEDL